MPVTSGADSVLNAIGGTPVVRLRRIVGAADADVVIKLEALNPHWLVQRSHGACPDCRRADSGGAAEVTATLCIAPACAVVDERDIKAARRWFSSDSMLKTRVTVLVRLAVAVGRRTCQTIKLRATVPPPCPLNALQRLDWHGTPSNSENC